MKKCELTKFIKERMQEEKGIALSDVDFGLPYSFIGVDSLSLVVLLCEIEDRAGRHFDLEDIDFDKITTLDALVEFLSEEV